MTILRNDIKIYQSQDNTDNDSGGGSRTSVEIIDGDINNLFPDISRIDTVSGDVGLRKVFPTVVTTNRDLYYGAHAMIRKTPTDPNVSSLLFHSDSATDKRIDAQNAIESYVIASYVEQFYLFGNHIAGSKSVTFLQRTTSVEPIIGEVYMLEESTGEQQFIRISSVDSTEIILSYSNSGTITDYTRRRVICEIEQPLDRSFVGSQFNPIGQESNTATTYATQIADAAKFYGTQAISENVSSGAQSVKVDSIFEQIVPASTKQTPLVNVQGLNQGTGLLATGNNESYAMTDYSEPNYSLGFPVVPNSITTFYTTDYIDDGIGNIKQVSTGDIKGQIDYKTGDLTNMTVGVSGSPSINYGSALVFNSDILYTKAKKITSGNQGLVYVENIDGVPSATDLYVDYRSNGKWYRFTSNGDGSVGNDASIGAGQINDNGDGTASLSLTLGALPDIDSTLIISWGSLQQVSTVSSTNATPDKDTRKFMSIPLGQTNIDPTSFTMSINRPDEGLLAVTSNSIGELIDAAVSDRILGQLDFINGELMMTNETSFGRRLDGVGTANDVVIDFDYSTTTTGQSGEIKQTVFSRTPTGGQVAFGTENTATGDLNLNLGETILPESVRLEFVIQKPYSSGSGVGSFDSNIVLQVNNSNQLVAVGSETVYGTVNVNGNIDLTFPSYDITYGGIWAQPRVTTTVFSQAWRNDYLDRDQITVSYQTDKDPSFSGSHNITDKIENIASYKIFTRPNIAGEVEFSFPVSSRNLYSFQGNVFRESDQFQVGTINNATGEITLTYFEEPNQFYLNFKTLKVDPPENGEIENGEISGISLPEITFRTSGSKLTPSSFQVRYETLNGSFSATSDANGVITGTDIDSGVSYIDSETGVAHITFTSDALPESIMYDAVAESSLPLDPELLGLNTVRLPVDGRVPIYDVGRHLVIFNEVTTATTNATPLADDVETLARSGQAYIEVIDVNGKRLDPVQYVADKVAGTVTFTNPLVLEDKYANALTAPFSIVDRVEDMLLATDVSITGTISLSGVLNNDYTAGDSYVASSLVWGDTGARVYNYFAQEIWNNGNPVWQDTIDGDPTTAQYDEVNYPIQITNADSTSGRWAIIFNSSTSVTVAHEVLGVVQTGISISVDDVAPINPATGSPYFTMDKDGFGAGWVTNNVIRINTDSGDNNMWVIRTVKSGALSESTDGIVLEIRGDAN